MATGQDVNTQNAYAGISTEELLLRYIVTWTMLHKPTVLAKVPVVGKNFKVQDTTEGVQEEDIEAPGEAVEAVGTEKGGDLMTYAEKFIQILASEYESDPRRRDHIKQKALEARQNVAKAFC